MPVYEFYCAPCHTVYCYHSACVDTRTVPSCPVCGLALSREVSLFSPVVRGDGESGGEPGGAAARMERALAQMGRQVESLHEDDADPREAVRVMRDLAAAGGLAFNREVREAMERIEAGEDPEKVDEAFREVFDTDNPFAEEGDGQGRGVSEMWRRLRGPRRDPVWRPLHPDPEGSV